MENFDVTLVITTYNEEKYLPILIDSIEKQETNLNMEIIIVDDFSTDDTLNIANEYVLNSTGNKIYKIIHNDKKSDVQYMRNLGLHNACGETILFCDADIALSKNYIETMIRPIIENKVDTMLCKTYAILEAFYDIRPAKYSKSYDRFLKTAPKFMFKRFPVQLLPWLILWFKNMLKEKKLLSIWSTPNRAHTTGISTRTEISKAVGGWVVRIGDGDDAKYSFDIFSQSKRILFNRKALLYISKRRVFPLDNSWISDIFFKDIKKLYNKIKQKNANDYSDSIR